MENGFRDKGVKEGRVEKEGVRRGEGLTLNEGRGRAEGDGRAGDRDHRVARQGPEHAG